MNSEAGFIPGIDSPEIMEQLRHEHAQALKHLGKRQRDVLLKMCEGAYIQIYCEAMRNDEYHLCCGCGDMIEELSERFVGGLCRWLRRDLFNRTSIRPSLNVDIVEYRLKPEWKAVIQSTSIKAGDVKGISDFLSGLNCETICD